MIQDNYCVTRFLGANQVNSSFVESSRLREETRICARLQDLCANELLASATLTFLTNTSEAAGFILISLTFTGKHICENS